MNVTKRREKLIKITQVLVHNSWSFELNDPVKIMPELETEKDWRACRYKVSHHYKSDYETYCLPAQWPLNYLV